MARIDVDLNQVLAAVVLRLQAVLTLNDSTCFYSINPDSPPPAPADLYLVVTPDGGTFDDGMFEGGGEKQLTCDTGFVVTIKTAMRLDAGGKDKERLTNASRGMIQMVGQILDALAGHDLLLSTGDAFLRGLLQPQGFGAPQKDGEKLGSIPLTFNLSFDWDVTPAA